MPLLSKRPFGAALAVLLALAGCSEPAPAELVVTAHPDDAVLVGEAGASGVGRLTLSGLPAGPHRVTVRRDGFLPGELAVDLAPGERHVAEVTLEPGLHPLTVAAHPHGAQVTVRAAGEVFEGPAPLSAEIPAGPVVVEVTADGHDPERRELFVYAAADLAFWLDPEGQVLDLARVLSTGRLPKQAAFTPDGRELWSAALDGPPTLFVHDPRTGALLDTLDVGEASVELAFSSDGTRAYTTEMEKRRAYEIDVRARRVLRTFRTGLWPKIVALSPDERTLYVANWLGNSVSEIDLATGAARREVPTVATPRGLYPTPDGASLYVAGFGGGELARIDLATGASEVVFSGGRNLRHLAADAERGLLYVSDMGRAAVWVHDLRQGTTRLLARTDRNPNTIALSPDGEVLFVSCRGRNGPRGYLEVGPEYGSVLAIDTRTGALLDAVVGGNQPTALALSPDGRTLAYSNLRDDDLHVFRVPDTATLRAGGGGRAAVYDLRKP